jgi:hypothetical protein
MRGDSGPSGVFPYPVVFGTSRLVARPLVEYRVQGVSVRRRELRRAFETFDEPVKVGPDVAELSEIFGIHQSQVSHLHSVIISPGRTGWRQLCTRRGTTSPRRSPRAGVSLTSGSGCLESVCRERARAGLSEFANDGRELGSGWQPAVLCQVRSDGFPNAPGWNTRGRTHGPLAASRFYPAEPALRKHGRSCDSQS